MTEKHWLLPAVIDPPRTCVQILVPDDPDHRNAFWGALQQLGYWHNWERDQAHTAVQVASVWTDILATAYLTYINEDCGTVADCTDLANCLDSNPDFQLALQQMVDNAVADVQPNPTQPISEARQEDNLMPAGAGCALDTVFGIVTALVDNIHQTTLDFLEIIEVMTNPAEIAGELTDNAGIFTAGASSALDIANWLQNNIQENYLAAYTTGIRDQIRCALFCNAKEGCSLSVADVFSVYSALSGAAVQPIVDFDSVINAIINLVIETELETVTRMHLVIVTILLYGSNWFNLSNFNSLAVFMALGANDPDPDHNLLCTDCVDLFWEIDKSWGAGLGDWQIQGGLYEGGRIRGVATSTERKSAIVKIQFTQSVKVRGAEVYYQRLNGGGQPQNNFTITILRPIIGSSTGQVQFSHGSQNGSIVSCQVRDALQGTFLCREILLHGAVDNEPGDEIYLDRIRIWGEMSPLPLSGATTSTQPQCSPP